MIHLVYYIDKYKINKSDIINFWNHITEDILKMDNTQLESSIWPLIKKYDLISLNFSNIAFKNDYSINQIFDKFNNNNNFCIKLKVFQDVQICLQSTKEEYISPLIMLALNDIKNYNIINKIKSLLNNEI